MDIPELPRANSAVLPDDFRESYMEEIMEEVKRSEQIRNEEGAMNMNLLPALKDGSTAAAKAFSTFIPGSSMLTHLIDGSMITDPFGRSDASGILVTFLSLMTMSWLSIQTLVCFSGSIHTARDSKRIQMNALCCELRCRRSEKQTKVIWTRKCSWKRFRWIYGIPISSTRLTYRLVNS